jgi:hypothetical protein
VLSDNFILKNSLKIFYPLELSTPFKFPKLLLYANGRAIIIKTDRVVIAGGENNMEKENIFNSGFITVGEYGVAGFESAGAHIIPPHLAPKRFCGDGRLWLLPLDTDGTTYEIACGNYRVERGRRGTQIFFDGEYAVKKHSGRPPCDFFGKYFHVDAEGAEGFGEAYARFYWDNLVSEIAERTFVRKKRRLREGYVLSTLNKRAYGGTYPAVDHEFHIKGRLAVGGAAEIALVRRMLEAQMKVMREDKKNLSRNVCSIQPGGRREYNVWRSSMNSKVRAQMFRLTANIEFVEAMYEYYSAAKDLKFLNENMSALEKNCSYIESFINSESGLLESHVYFEDQVIKEGYVAQAQFFAVNGFRLMAEMERLIENLNRAEYYSVVAARLAASAARSFPHGYWDGENGRFIDWIDKAGKAHDHIHLLANELPELFEIADEEQAQKCRRTVEEYMAVFKLFPSFVAAKIEDYDGSEIGTGGPYDLCAAGRYWCWDAAFLAFKKDGKALLKQLNQVYNQAKADNFLMGERYDMNYVYYNTSKDGTRNRHGADMYYEYPNVFLKVLVNDFLGLSFGFDTDLVIRPLFTAGSVRSENHGVEFTVKDGVLEIENISAAPLTVDAEYREKKRITLAPGARVTVN